MSYCLDVLFFRVGEPGLWREHGQYISILLDTIGYYNRITLVQQIGYYNRITLDTITE